MTRMNKERLNQILSDWINCLNNQSKECLKARLSSLKSVYPFNEYEYRLMFLLNNKVISFNEYEKLRKSYFKDNKYLELYELAPRTFGDIWIREHLIDIDKRFQLPNKELDSNYKGDYDLWIKGIRVEVKASRAQNTSVRGKMVDKALRFKDKEAFWMNFQQLKLDICDVFVFIGVWIDRICYWVLSNEEVKENKHLSPQHRGGIEYQIGITQRNLHEFDKFLASPSALVNVIFKKSNRKR